MHIYGEKKSFFALSLGDFFRWLVDLQMQSVIVVWPTRAAKMNNIMSMTIGRAARSTLLAHRRRAILVVPTTSRVRLLPFVPSCSRCISASAPSLLAAHPEDRLEAARKRARAALGLPENDGDVVAPSGVKLSSSSSSLLLQATSYSDKNASSTASPSSSSSQSSLHPEDRLKAARRKARAALGLPQDGDVHVMVPPQKVVTPTVAAVRPKAILAGLSAEQPPLVRNDGSSSGAVACMRLREARRNAMERLLASSSSSSASASAASSSKPTTDRKKS